MSGRPKRKKSQAKYMPERTPEQIEKSLRLKEEKLARERRKLLIEKVTANLAQGGYQILYSFIEELPKDWLESNYGDWIEEDEEVECNNCGDLMSLSKDGSIYICTQTDCTSCYDDDLDDYKDSLNDNL